MAYTLSTLRCFTTLASFNDPLEQAKLRENDLSFVIENKTIYRGTTHFSTGSLVVEELPLEPVTNIVYINKTDMTLNFWTGDAWLTTQVGGGSVDESRLLLAPGDLTREMSGDVYGIDATLTEYNFIADENDIYAWVIDDLENPSNGNIALGAGNNIYNLDDWYEGAIPTAEVEGSGYIPFRYSATIPSWATAGTYAWRNSGPADPAGFINAGTNPIGPITHWTFEAFAHPLDVVDSGVIAGRTWDSAGTNWAFYFERTEGTTYQIKFRIGKIDGIFGHNFEYAGPIVNMADNRWVHCLVQCVDGIVYAAADGVYFATLSIDHSNLVRSRMDICGIAGAYSGTNTFIADSAAWVYNARLNIGTGIYPLSGFSPLTETFGEGVDPHNTHKPIGYFLHKSSTPTENPSGLRAYAKDAEGNLVDTDFPNAPESRLLANPEDIVEAENFDVYVKEFEGGVPANKAKAIGVILDGKAVDASSEEVLKLYGKKVDGTLVQVNMPVNTATPLTITAAHVTNNVATFSGLYVFGAIKTSTGTIYQVEADDCIHGENTTSLNLSRYMTYDNLGSFVEPWHAYVYGSVMNDELAVDSAVTNGSNALITSGAVYTALLNSLGVTEAELDAIISGE